MSNQRNIFLIGLVLVIIVIIAGIFWVKTYSTPKKVPEIHGFLLPETKGVPPFALQKADGSSFTEKNFMGHWSLVFFGYTHCPDICPETMTRLLEVLQKLDSAAQKVRILFISVDPARDTPQSLHTYLGAFDAQHIVGLTGTVQQIEDLAKTYRVAYEAGTADTHENYEVMHSSAIYIFDPQGHARLMATGSDSAENIAHDLRLLIQKSPA